MGSIDSFSSVGLFKGVGGQSWIIWVWFMSTLTCPLTFAVMMTMLTLPVFFILWWFRLSRTAFGANIAWQSCTLPEPNVLHEAEERSVWHD